MKARIPRFYTTQVGAGQSANELCELLRQHSAKRYTVEWDENGDPASVAFQMEVPNVGLVPVKLLVQDKGILRRLRGSRAKGDLKARAKRVAWRQLLSYVEMVLEMAANDVKPFHEGFMADIMLEGGHRIADKFEETSRLLLGDGK